MDLYLIFCLSTCLSAFLFLPSRLILSVGLTSSLWGHSLYQGTDWCSRMFLSLVPHQEPFGVSWSGSENSCGPLGVCEFQIRNPWGKTDQLLCDAQILSLSVCKDIQNVTTVFIYIYIYIYGPICNARQCNIGVLVKSIKIHKDVNTCD